jgi:uncharacterized protein YdiU (UPF0061 family)
METFDPFYQPFTSDVDGKFAFIRQPQAMAVNVQVLGQTVKKLVRHVTASKASTATEEDPEVGRHLAALEHIAENEFQEYFFDDYRAMQQRKLGLRQNQDTIVAVREKCVIPSGFRSILTS